MVLIIWKIRLGAGQAVVVLRLVGQFCNRRFLGVDLSRNYPKKSKRACRKHRIDHGIPADYSAPMLHDLTQLEIRSVTICGDQHPRQGSKCEPVKLV